MATTSAGDLVRKACQEILVLGVQDTLSDSELEDSLDALNNMIDSWSSESLMIYAITQENFPLVSGTVTYTIGAGGDFNTPRPLKISQAFVRFNATDFPLDVIGRAQYDRLGFKTVQALPRYLFYDPAFPLGSISLYPVPSAGPYTLFIDSYKLLQEFANLQTAISLPPGYSRALIKNLALEIAPQFNVDTINPLLVKQAADSKGNLKRLNRRDFPVYVDAGLRVRGSQYDIASDNYR